MNDLVYILVIAVLLYVVYKLYSRISSLKFKQRSKDVKVGKWLEDFFPFLKDFPADPTNFKFLGEPIDGVSFSDDVIIFHEFKTGNAQLSEKQKNINSLVDEGKVKFIVTRIK